MKLQHYLKQYDRLAVALSGGADSACLLREAVSALGANRVLAVTVQTECTPQRRLRMAAQMAALADVEHVVVQADVLQDQSVLKNGPERPYFYQRALLHAALDEVWVRGCEHVADGLREDEAARQEHRAGEELNVLSPFIVCGMGAFQVAALRRGMGEDAVLLEGCLANRVPSGTPLTLGLLNRIDEAEETLLRMGFPSASVSSRGDDVLITLPAEKYDAFAGRRDEAEHTLKELGFASVQLVRAN